MRAGNSSLGSWGRRFVTAGRRLLGEPVVQFAVLGGCAWLALQWFDGRRIEIPATRFAQAAERMQAFLGSSALAPAQRLEADLRVLGDELLYREALRQGLDRDDPVIRQHLAQKLLMLEEELHLAQHAPDEPALRALYAEMAPQWTEPLRASFCHVYARGPLPDPARLAASSPAPSPSAPASAPQGCPTGVGEAFALGARFDDWSLREIEGRFGAAFARGVAEAPIGEWIGPLASRYGSHRVRVDRRSPAHVPRFEERREALIALWMRREREQVRTDLLRRLADRYDTRLERGAAADIEHRVALAAARLGH